MKVASITTERDSVVIRLLPSAQVSQDRIMEVVRSNRGRMVANFGKSPSVRIRRAGMDDEALLGLIENTLSIAGSRAPADRFRRSWADAAMQPR